MLRLVLLLLSWAASGDLTGNLDPDGLNTPAGDLHANLDPNG